MGTGFIKKMPFWRVSNGPQIDLFEDQWVPTVNNSLVGQGVGRCFSSFRESHLINLERREWRSDLMRLFFPSDGKSYFEYSSSTS